MENGSEGGSTRGRSRNVENVDIASTKSFEPGERSMNEKRRSSVIGSVAFYGDRYDFLLPGDCVTSRD